MTDTTEPTPFEEQVLTALEALNSKIHNLETRINTQIEVLIGLVGDGFKNIEARFEERFDYMDKQIQHLDDKVDIFIEETKMLKKRIQKLEHPNTPAGQLR